jgi:hypothetical protein
VGLITEATIDGNVVHDNGAKGGAGINLDGVQASRIQNNLLYENHANGITLFKRDGGGGSCENVVVNNTVINATDGRYAVHINAGSTGNAVFNNVLYSLNARRGAISVSKDSAAGLVSDHNLVAGRFAMDDRSLSLAEWTAATGGDAHSASLTLAQLQALFRNYAGDDFRLVPGSAAINAGAVQLHSGSKEVAAPTADLLGVTRLHGSAPDVGAYESE